MAAYEEDAADNEWGDSGTWNTGQASVPVQYSADGGLAFCKFTGAAALLSSDDIATATLHLEFNDPLGDAYVRIWGVKLDPPQMPGGAGWSTAWGIWQDYRSAIVLSFNANGLTEKDINCLTLIEELRAHNSEDDHTDIVLLITQDNTGDTGNPGYMGNSVGNVTFRLISNFDGLGDVFPVEVDQPEGIIELQGAACSAEVHIDVDQPVGTIELVGSTHTAVTAVLVDQPAGIIELVGSTPSAITNLAVTQPEGIIELEGAACSAETAVNVDQPVGFIELVGSIPDAVTAVILNQPAGAIELEGGTCSAVTTVIVSQPQGTIELVGSTPSAVVPPVVSQAAATIELIGGRHWITPSWKTVTLGSLVLTTGGAK